MSGERWQVWVSLLDSLSKRERFLLGGLAGILSLLLVYWLIGGVVARAGDIQVELENRRFNLHNIEQLKSEKKRLNALLNKRQEFSLFNHLELLAEQLGFQDKIRIKELSQGGSSNTSSVEVLLESLTWDEVVYMTYLIESSSVPMVIRLSEVGKDFDNLKLLRLKLRVVGL